MDAREFNDTFLQITLERLSYENKDIILMGNFNIDILKYDTNNDSAAFLDMMYENFLLPYISSPTRVTPRSQSLIDNIFSNIIEDEIISGNITTTISDHYAQFTLFKNKTKSQNNKKIAKFARNYKTLDKEMFDSDLKNTNWKEILKIERGDVDYSFDTFNKKINEILDKHGPFKKLSIQDEKLSKKPWITTGILNSIKNKNRLYRKVIRAKDPERIRNLRNKFKLYRNKLDKILKASKSMHYQKYFETNKLNLCKTWEGIRQVINIRKKKGQTINTLNSDNGIINEDRKISEQFNKHFCNIATTIEKEIPSAKNNFSDYLKNAIKKTFFINPTTADEVETQIKCLKNNKATGPKSIPTSIFKNFRKSLSVPLAEIINLSFNEGKFPTQLKSANVIPVSKKGDKLEVNNYVPISLISNISKVIEN